VTELRLVENPAGPATLPRGRHGLPAELVRAHQRQRILEAAAAALAEQGYGYVTAGRVIELARVSSRTFYQHFDDLWSCLAAAYETEAEHLCKEVESAGAGAAGDRRRQARAGIRAALDFLASELSIARLLTAEPPPQAEEIVAARRSLAEQLGAWLRRVREPGAGSPPALERRLIGAALALASTHVAAGEPQRLRDLEPALSEYLLAPL
jgi:AcrR family transcriptional regulator